MDFEQGLHNAIRSVFPGSKVVGCLFHIKKRLFNKGRELGLMKKEHSENF